VFEKPEESSQHLKPLYIRGHIDGKLIARMLVDGGVAVNLIPYSMFKKLGREDDKLVKTNLMLNGVEVPCRLLKSHLVQSCFHQKSYL
jgi:hypothetical protein